MPTNRGRYQVTLPPHLEWALKQDCYDWGKTFPLSYQILKILDEHYTKLGRGMEEFKQALKLRGQMGFPMEQEVPVFEDRETEESGRLEPEHDAISSARRRQGRS